MVMRERVGSFFRVNRWLIVSLIALGAAVYLSTRYLDQILQASSSPSTPVAEATVVVARSAIPAYGTISAAEVSLERLPAADVPPGAMTSVSQVVGQWSNEAIQPGVPIVDSAVFSPKSANVLASRIQPGDMAVDVPLNASDVVDGLVEPGDNVSLFTTITEANNQQVTEDFLNNVKVLAVNGSFVPATTPTTGQNLTLILALPPQQIARLLFTQQKGPIEAVLDAPNATTVPPTPFGTLNWQKPVP